MTYIRNLFCTLPLMFAVAACENPQSVSSTSNSAPIKPATQNEFTSAAGFQSPYLTPGTCRKVYIVTSDQSKIIPELKRIEGAFRRLGGRYGIYQIADGRFIGADTMERYFENPREYVSKLAKRNVGPRKFRSDITRYIRNASLGKPNYYLPSAYCSTGEEIIADTGKRYYNPTKTGSSLLLNVAASSLSAMREAHQNADYQSVQDQSSGNVQNAQTKPTASNSTSNTQLQVTESGKSASGKTAYEITCPQGRKFRIWNSDGQWWDARGAQGGNYRTLKEQAAFLCG